MTGGVSSESGGTQNEETTSAAATDYFLRRLSIGDVSPSNSRVDEAGLLALAGNKIVLGEPGMGKSELMLELGRRLGVEVVNAIRFINSKRPAKLVKAGKPLLVDGLDEAMSRRDGDAIDAILAQLEEADSPDFILSCRSREWQARGMTNLRQVYGAEPTILTLDPFERADAHAYLRAQYPSVSADHVLDHLAAHNLEELYRNPLTLGLMGKVARSDTQLPATRAALFERVCTQTWPEHDPERQDLGLAQLAEEEVLDAAGAIAAGLLFSGAEAVSCAGAAQVDKSDLRLVDLESLPQSATARVIFSSKLFVSVGQSRAKPIHRVIAEYLGARWLAKHVPTPRAQRRLLAQMHGSGGVPASLRGLHAWLAYHSTAMAERVIAADPYGVLRYGETSVLTTHLADCLFNSLDALAGHDPYFRAADWDVKTAAGLMIPTLKSKIDAVISSETSSVHLRSLLIEALEGLPMAAELSDTLETILLSRERVYRERDSAASALLPYRDRAWWQASITTLTGQADEDGPRLARELIEKIDADVSDSLLVATLFAEMGATSSPWPRRKSRRVHSVKYYDRLLATIPSERLAVVLGLIADYSELIPRGDWENASDVADIVGFLVIRAIDERVIGPCQAQAAWRWLGIFEHAQGFRRDLKQALEQRLITNDPLRRAIQTYVLEAARREEVLRVTELHLQRRLVGLSGRPGDIVCALDCLADADNRDQPLREDWMDLVRLGWGPEGLAPEMLAAAERFRRGDKPLADFYSKLRNPKKPAWEIKRERDAAKQARKRQVSFETARRFFDKHRLDLRAGKLEQVLTPAKAYFNLVADLPRDMPPRERLAEWIGPALRDDVLVGFEAVLHRTDLPTAADIAEGFSQDSTYNYSYPIMAGICERIQSGRGISDLSAPVKLAALLLSHDSHGWAIDGEDEAVRQALEAEVIPTPEARQAFARLWVVPALAAGKERVSALYILAHEREWQPTGAALGAEWLAAFPNAPRAVEAALVDCLVLGGARDALRDIAEKRAEGVFQTFEQMLAWLAIDVLVRFEAVMPDLRGIGASNPEFIWCLRDRLQFEEHGRLLPLTVAQAEWIIAEFRGQWTFVTLIDEGSGDHSATDFLRSLISRIADDISVEASDAMGRLVAGPADTYSDLIRHMSAEQHQKRVEAYFSATSPSELAALLNDGPPDNIEDLKALVLEELDVARRKLLGDDLDSVVDFWTDDGIPRDENRCRDRLASMIGPELNHYGIQRITEADMPKTKRADIAFAHGSRQLPVEVKGQWHPDVWDAATGQLDIQYLVDWRSEQRGIYCVLWFGNLPSSSNRRLKSNPDGLSAPANAEEMRTMLIARIPEPRRALIDVVVFDFTAGKKCTQATRPLK